MQTDFYIVKHRHLPKQANVLKGSCDPHAVDLNLFLSDNVFTVQKDLALRRLINTGEHIEYRRFTCPVGTDQAVKLPCLDLH